MNEIEALNELTIAEAAQSAAETSVESLKAQVNELTELVREQNALLKTQLLSALQDDRFALLVVQALLQIPQFPQLLMGRMAEEQIRHDVDIDHLDFNLSETEQPGMEKFVWFDDNYAVPEEAGKLFIIRADDEKMELIPKLDTELKRLFVDKGFSRNQPFWASIQMRPQETVEIDPDAIGEVVAQNQD